MLSRSGICLSALCSGGGGAWWLEGLKRGVRGSSACGKASGTLPRSLRPALQEDQVQRVNGEPQQFRVPFIPDEGFCGHRCWQWAQPG